VKSLKLWG